MPQTAIHDGGGRVEAADFVTAAQGGAVSLSAFVAEVLPKAKEEMVLRIG